MICRYIHTINSIGCLENPHWPWVISDICTENDAIKTKLVYSGFAFLVYFWRSTILGVYNVAARTAAILSALALVTRKYFVQLPLILYGIIPVLASINIYFLPETLNIPLMDTIKDLEKRWALMLVWFCVKVGCGILKWFRITW